MAVSFRIAVTTTASSGTNIVLNKHVSVVEGDLMIAQLFVGASSAPTITPPAGWTSRGSGAGSVPRAQIFTKIAGAGEPSSYTFTSSLTIVTASASLSAYYSDNGIVIGDYEFDSVAKSPSVAPSVDVVTANSKLFCAFATNALGSGVTGMSARIELDNGVRDIATFDQDIASPGATGTKTYTGSSSGWGFSLSIEEAVAAAPSAGLERMLGNTPKLLMALSFTPSAGLSRMRGEAPGAELALTPQVGLARVQGNTPAVELAWTPQAGLMRMIGQEPTTAEETGGLWGKSGAASGTWGKAGASGSGSWGKAPIAH